MTRCFIAVYPIKNSVLEKVIDLQKEISKLIKGKAVEKENIHITISFLGELKEGEIEIKKRKLRETASKLKRREILIEKIKAIPNTNFIKVIAANVCGLEDVCEEVKKNVGGDAKPPHLTLLRVKSIIDRKKLLDIINNVEINENFEVDSIKLMKSTLTKNGPIYEIIETIDLLK
ncbi:MAG: RNA 2',3'-cyclic phosphodiesterase [Candidatus Aenigmatarchaeota archaeon]